MSHVNVYAHLLEAANKVTDYDDDNDVKDHLLYSSLHPTGAAIKLRIIIMAWRIIYYTVAFRPIIWAEPTFSIDIPSKCVCVPGGMII